MKIIAPAYYNSFGCTADKCRHSCCIGWEIDIDEKTAEKYKQITGDFGKRLQEGMTFQDGVYSFKLTEEEKCPFLNAAGLCDIYTCLGEESLCNICRDHPRFRNYFSSHMEIGLGLCCEAAAKLIIEDKNPAVFDVISSDISEDPTGAEKNSLTEDEEYLLKIREDIFGIIRSSSGYKECAEKILEYTGAVYPQKHAGKWAEIFLNLERLDESWTVLLEKLRDESKNLGYEQSYFPGEFDMEFKNLLVYFIYRHLADAWDWQELCARLCLAFLGCEMINFLCLLGLKERGSVNIGDLEEYSRLYSSEIEYSKENTEALLEIFMDENL